MHLIKWLLSVFFWFHVSSASSLLQVTGSRGNNLHDAVTAQGETFLVSMPTKFRKNIWIKRGKQWKGKLCV